MKSAMNFFAAFCFMLLFGCLATSAQEWGNVPTNNPTYTVKNVGIGFLGHGAERDLHIRYDGTASPFAPLEDRTPGIRIGSYAPGNNVWDIYADATRLFEIRHIDSEEDIPALSLFDEYRAGLWQNNPQTLFHIGEYRQITFGHTGGDGNGLYGEYMGFNVYLEQHEGSANTITKLPGGSPTGGGQTGGAIIATDYDGNMEFQTLNTAEPTDMVQDIAYDPNLRLTNKGVLEFARTEEAWTANHWNINMKAPISTTWMTTNTNTNGDYMGIGMTGTGWYFIRSKNAPGGTDPEIDQCGWYPFYVTVAGKAVTREVEVKIENWCDYVFEDDYDLMPLETVESFVKQNRHLPDIPSEKEVLADGIELGEMNALLLKKVEELTLYIIEQDKRLKALENRKR